MREWYDGYRFAKTAPNVVYNTDMVLYYLSYSLPNKPGPDNLIDDNVRIDYGKLRHLLTVGRQLNGNFDLLREVIAEGRADCEIVSSFPLARLAERENFLSLLHYFGLLSIRGATVETPRLGIPNQTVRRLLYGYLRDAYRDVGVFSLDLVRFDRLARRMALQGEWRPALERLSAAVAEQTGVRDYLQGEKMVQGFVAAYLSISPYFVLHTEMELAKGYADLVLEPRALPLSGQALRLRDRAEVPAAQRNAGAGSGAGRRRGGAGAPLPDGPAAGAPAPGGGVQGAGAGVPRLGTGARRRGPGQRRSGRIAELRACAVTRRQWLSPISAAGRRVSVRAGPPAAPRPWPARRRRRPAHPPGRRAPERPASAPPPGSGK